MPIERKRGRFLTVWLILLPIANTVILLWCWVVMFIVDIEWQFFHTINREGSYAALSWLV
jgi:hypothetical protein